MSLVNPAIGSGSRTRPLLARHVERQDEQLARQRRALEHCVEQLVGDDRKVLAACYSGGTTLIESRLWAFRDSLFCNGAAASQRWHTHEMDRWPLRDDWHTLFSRVKKKKILFPRADQCGSV
jgi:hypothetical protein